MAIMQQTAERDALRAERSSVATGVTQDAPLLQGIHALIAGYNMAEYAQIAEHFQAHGGKATNQYTTACTHVIVHGHQMGDPVCTAARDNGKILVNSTWLLDCLETGELPDPRKVLYLPPKSLAGIPGADLLTISLTGYQGRARKYVEALIKAMGAKFTKSLTANLTTHLVCYTHEGAKYEMAKKTRMHLVNERWLEDCLRQGSLQPEDIYLRSGCQIEEENEAAMTRLDGLQAGRAKSSTGRAAEAVNAVPQQRDAPASRVGAISGEFTVSKKVQPAIAQGGAFLLGLAANMHDATSETCVEAQDNLVGGLDKSRIPEWLQGNGRDAMRGPSHDIADVSETAQLKASVVTEILPGPSPSPNKLDTSEQSAPPAPCTIEKTPGKITDAKPGRQVDGASGAKDLQAASTGRGRGRGKAQGRGRHAGGSRSSGVGRKSTPALVESDESIPLWPSSTETQKLEDGAEGGAVKNQFRQDVAVNSEWTTGAVALPDNCRQEPPVGDEDQIQGGQADENRGQRSAQPSETTGEAASHQGGGASTPPRRLSFSGPTAVTPESGSENLPLAAMVAARQAAAADSEDIILASIALAHPPAPTGSKELPAAETAAAPPPAAASAGVTACVPTPVTLGPQAQPIDAVAEDGKTGESKYLMKHFLEELKERDICDTEVVAIREKKSTMPAEVLQGRPSSPRGEEKDIASPAKKVKGRGPIKRKAKEPSSSGRLKKACRPQRQSNGHEQGVAAQAGSVVVKHAREPSTPRTEEGPLPSVGRITSDPMLQDGSHGARSPGAVKAIGKAQTEAEVNGGAFPLLCGAEGGAESTSTEGLPSEHVREAGQANTASGGGTGPHAPSAKKVATKQPERHSMGSSKASQEEQRKPSAGRCFALGGMADDKDEFRMIIRKLGGRLAGEHHEWKSCATHVILPAPLRRTEKLFAGMAAGRWILKPEYLQASLSAGHFLEEAKYEWHDDRLSADGSVHLSAPRKWRQRAEAESRGAFHGLRVVLYGSTSGPPPETLKRALKAGGATIKAVAPPYRKHLSSGVDIAVVPPDVSAADPFVSEFLKKEVACVTGEFLVDYVTKPGPPQEAHVLLGTMPALSAALDRLARAPAEQHGTPPSDTVVSRRSIGGSRQVSGKVLPTAKGAPNKKHKVTHQPARARGDGSAGKATSMDEVDAEESQELGAGTGRAGSEDSGNSLDSASCTECHRKDREKAMLLCDGTGCRVATHMHCLVPPLIRIPEGDWFCGSCLAGRS